VALEELRTPVDRAELIGALLHQELAQVSSLAVDNPPPLTNVTLALTNVGHDAGRLSATHHGHTD